MKYAQSLCLMIRAQYPIENDDAKRQIYVKEVRGSIIRILLVKYDEIWYILSVVRDERIIIFMIRLILITCMLSFNIDVIEVQLWRTCWSLSNKLKMQV